MENKPEVYVPPDEPIHNFFSLSYAQYLAIPRSVLQSMPVEWQQRFVACLKELDSTIDWRPDGDVLYQVRLMTLVEKLDEDDGRWIQDWGVEVGDPLADYERGRRRVPHK